MQLGRVGAISITVLDFRYKSLGGVCLWGSYVKKENVYLTSMLATIHLILWIWAWKEITFFHVWMQELNTVLSNGIIVVLHIILHGVRNYFHFYFKYSQYLKVFQIEVKGLHKVYVLSHAPVYLWWDIFWENWLSFIKFWL